MGNGVLRSGCDAWRRVPSSPWFVREDGFSLNAHSAFWLFFLYSAVLRGVERGVQHGCGADLAAGKGRNDRITLQSRSL